jgi:uncharacterized protein DUF5412
MVTPTRRLKLFAIGYLIVMLGCSSPCGNEIVSQTPSPDGKLVATVFVRDCGAATKAATWVTLHGPSENYGKKSSMVFTASQEQRIVVSWNDSSNLSINCVTCRAKDFGYQTATKGAVHINIQSH